MPITRQGANDAMTPESIQAMIDRAIHRNSTHNQEDASQNSSRGPRRPVQPARVCSYTDFTKCQPLNFKRTKGVIGLSQWVKNMESVFHISGCAVENHVKFATCTLLGAVLTWWNGHVRTLDHDVAYAMTWEILKKKLTNKYCPKETPHYAERQAENKRKLDNNNQAQQQLLKKQNVVQAYTIETGEKKPYGGSKPLCPKYNYHHDGECAPKCTNYKKIGHLTKDCWHPINANNQRTITCYECGNQGHYMSDCPVLKKQGTEARGRVYALEGGETNQDLDNAGDDINA
uniref:CCHC-type domain-containing protein n=1 Tax=Tanacetum cinerariifolium TaxID=118510 RepID=A0A699J6S2_TANCI|nr:hypothetical protein [Tanacetum cinerariifolium]